MKSLSGPEQIKIGATVILAFNGDGQVHKVVEVLHTGTGQEEILLDADKNLYFITSMAIAGTSWAKGVKFANPQQPKP